MKKGYKFDLDPTEDEFEEMKRDILDSGDNENE